MQLYMVVSVILVSQRDNPQNLHRMSGLHRKELWLTFDKCLANWRYGGGRCEALWYSCEHRLSLAATFPCLDQHRTTRTDARCLARAKVAVGS